MAGVTLIPTTDAALAALSEGAAPELRLPEDWAMLDPVRERLAGSARIWLIASNGAIAGLCAFLDAPEDAPPEIGYGTAPSFRGQGLAQAAVRALQDQATTEHLPGLTAQSLAANPASGRVLAACGFQEIGTKEVPRMGTVVSWLWTPT